MIVAADAVVHALPAFVVVIDPIGGIEFVNQRFLDYTGLNAEHACRHGWAAVLHPAELAKFTAALRAALATGGDFTIDARARRVDGHYRWFLFRASPVRDAERAILKWYGTAVDIEDQKQAEAKLRLRARLAVLLMSKLEFAELLSQISGALREHLTIRDALLAVTDDGSAKLRVFATSFHNPLGFVSGTLCDADEVPGADAMLRGETYALTGEQLARWSDGPLGTWISRGIRSLCTLPLTTKGRPRGLLLVGSASGGAFSPRVVELLTELATTAAIAVDNAWAYRRVCAVRDRLTQEKLYLEGEMTTTENFAEIVGSRSLASSLKEVEHVAPTTATTLLLGETGTGKELLARAIHRLSARRDKPFVRVNCAAIPATLLESELFGYERGAFTGAFHSKIGRFELAHGGTLFLDEVGDIPMEVQPKLLRAIQEREFERLGGRRTHHVDVRLIAATNRDLQAMVADGTFRRDLFYRLGVVPITVPPLRQRRADIPELVRFFVRKYARQLNRSIETIPSATMSALQEWDWPGNVRELENVIERAVILSGSTTLEVGPLGHQASAAAAGPAIASALEQAERRAILDALGQCRGIVAGPNGAARRLGIKRTTLQSKMRRLGIRGWRE